MITLFGFGPAFGLPDPSPFVMKTEVQLKMAGLAYRWERAAPPNAPKGKIPYIEDEGVLIADSTFIRQHIETAYGVDLDNALLPEERAYTWAIERMLEDHLYFAILQTRWMNDTNFAKGPAHFFDGAPEGVREAARERTRSYLHGHGLGRHSDAEISFLARKSLATCAAMLGDKPYLMGHEPCGTDATLFGMTAAILTPFFDSRLRDAATAHDNLVAYRDRMITRYYPEFAKKAA